MQRVETVTRLGDRGIDVVHRQEAETAEPPRILSDQFGGVVVTFARKIGGLVGGEETDARLCDRRDCQCNAVFVHEVERKVRRPVRVAPDRGPAAGLIDRFAIELRNEMKVYVDLAGCRSACHAVSSDESLAPQ